MTNIAGGEEPTDDNVECIWALCGVGSASQASCFAKCKSPRRTISRDDTFILFYIVDIWTCFQESKTNLQEWMKSYTSEGDAGLTRNELRAVLQEINGNQSVSEQALDWVFQRVDLLKTGSITLIGLMLVHSMWECYCNSCEEPQRSKDSGKARCNIM